MLHIRFPAKCNSPIRNPIPNPRNVHETPLYDSMTRRITHPKPPTKPKITWLENPPNPNYPTQKQLSSSVPRKLWYKWVSLARALLYKLLSKKLRQGAWRKREIGSDSTLATANRDLALEGWALCSDEPVVGWSGGERLDVIV